MRIRLLTIMLALFTVTSVFSQPGDPKLMFEKAEGYMAVLNFSDALPYLLRVHEFEPQNANVNFKIGLCYLASASDKAKAIPYLRKAMTDMTERPKGWLFKEKRAPEDAVYRLAEAYHFGYEFDSAIVYYEKVKHFAESEELNELIDKKIEMCEVGKEMVKNPVKMQIHNMGEKINSKYPEHSPVLSADESMMIYTSRNPSSTGDSLNLTEDGKYFEDIYISYKIDVNCKENCEWTKPIGIGNSINTENHEATIGLSADGTKLFIYRDDFGDGNIYESDLVGDSWSPPIKLPAPINSEFLETHASISSDENILYFASDRPDGYGGQDIYRVRKLPNGNWGVPENLGPSVNTKYDETSPFIHPDGVTLYFSSDGHKSMGGFDIFKSVFAEENGWSVPENIGYPINTTDDDISYVMSPDGKRAYYSSAASKNRGHGDKDIYQVVLEVPEVPLTVMKGAIHVSNGESIPEDARIVVTDNETQELIGIYKPNTLTGKYLLILQPKRNYNISFEANNYLFWSENLFVPDATSYQEIQNEITLDPIEIENITVLRNVFFESASANLLPESKVELDKLYELLMSNPKLVVGIFGHTDSKGSATYNKNLSQNRAESVVEYLIEKGVNGNRLSAKGMGEEEPVAKNKNPDGTWNDEGMALNRRIELKILDTEGEVKIVEDIKVDPNLKLTPEDNDGQ